MAAKIVDLNPGLRILIPSCDLQSATRKLCVVYKLQFTNPNKTHNLSFKLILQTICKRLSGGSLQLVRIVATTTGWVLVLVVVIRTARHLFRLVTFAAHVIVDQSVLARQFSWHSLRKSIYTNIELLERESNRSISKSMSKLSRNRDIDSRQASTSSYLCAVGRMRMTRLYVQAELFHMFGIAQVLVGSQDQFLDGRTFEANDWLGSAGGTWNIFWPVTYANGWIEH